MVKICDINNYPSENEEKYKEHFTKFPYELSIFQKHAIEGIIEGNHVLITAHTGSGKTLAGEFAIEHFVAKGKKVIYTGPTKSLINQKFYDFTKKYEHISFGILTGDVKTNPEADVLVVTAEILLNKLYQNNNILKSASSFEMDFNNELACVIMDEVHYVNDKDRGGVWETTIMMLPQHVQMVMLSATIDKPEKFAQWCENIHPIPRQVYLTNTTHRVVPLTHYSFITATQGIFKCIKDKAVHEEIRRVIDKPLVIQDAKGEFNETNYRNVTKILKLLENNDIRMKRQHILNKISEHLVENELLPALCFVLSRKQLEICAHEVTTNLLEFDSKVPYIIDRECEQIIRKLPNYKEYLLLPEYLDMVSLLRKGIAIHHSGVTPILKEMVELLYSKGYIKLLFATETFSVGVNMPTKSVIFTDVNKFDGNISRTLYAHEYVQMAGRAGRRGLDTVGHVIHLNNLFRDTSATAYKTMMNGKPQTLTSKFKISYNLLLNLIDIGDNNLVGFAKKSMVIDDLNGELRQVSLEIDKCSEESSKLNEYIETMRTPKDVVEQYNKLQSNKENYANKKRKEMEKEIQKIKDEYKYVDQDLTTLQKSSQKMAQLGELTQRHKGLSNYLDNDVNKVLHVLTRDGFITNSSECISLESEGKNEQLENERLDSVGLDLLDEEIEIVNDTFEDEPALDKLQLSLTGKMATGLREVHCLVFARLLEDNSITNLSVIQLIALFSCFTNISVQEGIQDFTPRTDDDDLKQVIYSISKMYSEYEERESLLRINTGADYTIHYDLLNYVEDWTKCESVEDCRDVLSRLSEEKEIFLGEFVKALLKINNISCEMEQIAEQMSNIEFLSKLKQIPELTLKYVVTNQSLYV